MLGLKLIHASKRGPWGQTTTNHNQALSIWYIQWDVLHISTAIKEALGGEMKAIVLQMKTIEPYCPRVC